MKTILALALLLSTGGAIANDLSDTNEEVSAAHGVGACWRFVENRPHACRMIQGHVLSCDEYNELEIFGSVSRGLNKFFRFYPGRSCAQ